MSRPMLIRRSVAGVTAVIVLVVGFLMVSSYEQAALYKQKESDSPLTARWLDIAFVGATDPNAPARRNSRVFLSSRLLAEAASTIESAAPTATVATSAPSAPPTAFPSSKHPSVSPSTSAPSPQPTFSVSRHHFHLFVVFLRTLKYFTFSHRNFRPCAPQPTASPSALPTSTQPSNAPTTKVGVR
jgi:hypothetical protein